MVESFAYLFGNQKLLNAFLPLMKTINQSVNRRDNHNMRFRIDYVAKIIAKIEIKFISFFFLFLNFDL